MDKFTPSDRYKKGLEIMQHQLGKETADKHIAHVNSISAIFGQVNVEFPFGTLYARNVLDSKTRELITIGALTVLGCALPELNLHVKGALSCGATREEILEVITQMISYCGFPAATNALFKVQETFDEIDGKNGAK